MRVRQHIRRLRSLFTAHSQAPSVRRVPGADPATLPGWSRLLDVDRDLWYRARRRALGGPKILIATSVAGFSALSAFESLLAVALTLRGAEVDTLVCDGVLPACLRAERPEIPDPGVFARYELPDVLCDGCVSTGESVYGPLGLRNHRFGELVTGNDRMEARRLATEVSFEEISTYRLMGWGVGEHAYAGALRYFASGNLNNEPEGELVVRRYFEGALLTAAVMRRLLGERLFVASCFNHGIYSPQGVVGEACRSAGVRVVNWNIAYRKRCFIFSHEDTYHHTLLSEPTDTWEAMPWDAGAEERILAYLKSRWSGSRDWIWFHDKPDEDFEKFARGAGLDTAKPIVGLLTNVMWDAQLHYRANAFPDMLSWVLATIEYFGRRPQLQLLIRVHPAEVRGTLPSRQPLIPEIAKMFPRLPANVFIVPPESPVSTYAAMTCCNAAIIYGTKTGVELASLGIPVIVAGEAWIRNKDLSIDASSPKEYFEILDRLPLARRDDYDHLTRARKYAYHFFFRRMIPVAAVAPADSWPPYRVVTQRLEELFPGRDPGLDVICDGILSGSPFVYPAEKLGVHDA